jgi:hypothetical protein
MTSATDNQGFFSLPGEIRTKIYNLLLKSNAVYQNSDLRHNNTIAINRAHRTQGHTKVDPNILCTCRRIAFEASPILYTSNNVTFQAIEDVTGWLATIGPQKTKMVRFATTYTSIAGFKMDNFEEVFKRCSGLRRLHVRAATMSYAPAYHEKLIREFLRLAQPLLKDHPTLSRLMSKWNGGYQHKSTGSVLYPHYWDALCVSFVASVDDGMPGVDGMVIDIGDAIEDVGDELIGLGT